MADDIKKEEAAAVAPVAEAVKEAGLPAGQAGTVKGKKGAKKDIKPRSRKKKIKQAVTTGRVYVQATYNNTLVTITDASGNVLAWSSAGLMGFKGPKKATPYAAGIIVKDVVDKVKLYGFKEASLFVKGIGAGRDAAIRAVYANGLNILSIKDITPIPHNGCRPPKVRRV